MPEVNFPIDPPSTRWINPDGTPTPEFWEMMRKLHQRTGGDTDAVYNTAVVAGTNPGASAYVGDLMDEDNRPLPLFRETPEHDLDLPLVNETPERDIDLPPVQASLFSNEDGQTALQEALRAASLAELALSKATATGWDDFVVPVTTGRQGALSKPDFDYTGLGYLFPKNDNTEILYLIAQLPHSWRQAGNIYPHVHLVQDADVAYTMKADYKWFNPVGAAIPGAWTTYTMSNQLATYSAGSISQILNNATPIDASGFTVSSILLIKLYRDDNVGSADLLVHSFDFHLEKDGLGSEDQYEK